MKGGIRAQATTLPVAAPAAAPSASPAPMPRNDEPLESMTSMATQPDRAASEPTDRSMPAVMMMKVIPAEMMALMETWRATFNRLDTVRKFSVARDMAASSTNSTAMAP